MIYQRDQTIVKYCLTTPIAFLLCCYYSLDIIILLYSYESKIHIYSTAKVGLKMKAKHIAIIHENLCLQLHHSLFYVSREASPLSS